MPWPLVEDCPEFQSAHWVHPMFQKTVCRIIEYTKDKFPFITQIVVFGSAVTNRCHSRSDIDLCIFGDYNLKFRLPLDLDVAHDIVWAQHLLPSDELWRDIEEKGVVVYGPFFD